MADENKGVFIEPSASGPMQKVGRDGVVRPGKLGQAQKGAVTNPGVRHVGTGPSAPSCPFCGGHTLKMRMNVKTGERIYCSNPDCNYDQRTQKGKSTATVNPKTKVISSADPQGASGVKILRQNRVG